MKENGSDYMRIFFQVNTFNDRFPSKKKQQNYVQKLFNKYGLLVLSETINSHVYYDIILIIQCMQSILCFSIRKFSDFSDIKYK
jgi:hypothetical protein